jgi:hypothetical protein
MFRFQHSVVTKASPELAWEIFSNLHRWNNFANIYGRLEWREGAPWQPGSRLDIEILRPVHTVIEHVITSCVPAKRLGWIDHAMGVAMAQWVNFEPHKSGGTRIHTWGDLVHSGVSIGGRPGAPRLRTLSPRPAPIFSSDSGSSLRSDSSPLSSDGELFCCQLLSSPRIESAR